MSYCDGCESKKQQLINAKAQDNAVRQQAENYAIQNKQDVALYTNDQGELCFIPANQSVGYPVTGYISHILLNTSI